MTIADSPSAERVLAELRGAENMGSAFIAYVQVTGDSPDATRAVAAMREAVRFARKHIRAVMP